jgi:hypothetical protein
MRKLTLAALAVALAAPAMAAEKFPPGDNLSVEDLVLDKAKNVGMLYVEGHPGCLSADFCYLYGDTINANIQIDATKLPHDDRKRLLGCDPIVKKCDVVVLGMKWRAIPNLIVTAIEWK